MLLSLGQDYLQDLEREAIYLRAAKITSAEETNCLRS